MKRRILIGFIALILVFAAVAVVIAAMITRTVARDQLLTQVNWEADRIIEKLEGRDTLEALSDLVTPSRVTLIEKDGSVLFDSWADEPLENHGDRPEVAGALAGGSGSAIRYSETTRSTAVYVARALPEGHILRVAAPERIARGIARGVAPWLVFGLLLMGIVTIIFANYLGDRLIKPILAIDVERPEDAVIYDELLPLIRRIDEQNHHTRAQMEALEARRLELNTLLDGMHEGFIALGAREEIILINPSACRMLGVSGEQAAGRQLPEINRSPVILSLLENLRKGGTAEGQLEKDGRSYLLSANRIQGHSGAILLLSDQTYRVEGESMRKQFTANVSHELRTPLTTICGYAELLDKGMVKPEDAGRFYQIIHHESSRMLALVEDILRLSRLDEGHLSGRKQPVNLNEVARSVSQSLELSADEKAVSLAYEGEDAYVLGDATLLSELTSNLIDNAIKYNVDKGSVAVRVTSGAQVLLTVSDTGIGIEPEHQERVFERFYRTDNSRSKETGGTGLGLSIVKHAAEFHKARITLKSEPGKGTAITVAFPPYRADQ